MTSAADPLYNTWLNTLGWTLLHSLWQAMLLFIAIWIAFRLIPTGQSSTRYAIACAGLFLFLASVVTTFICLFPTTGNADEFSAVGTIRNVGAIAGNKVSLLPVVRDALQNIMPFILLMWAAGVFIFSVRLSGAIIYTYRIRSTATPVPDWLNFLADAQEQLGIRKVIALAASSSISSPMVIGYIKPMILFPAGMLSGMTTEQIETVILHELAHIKRHDYLINVLQSVIETIFFFNPFVWMISNIIKREREYCCDDIVVNHHSGSKAYAYALAHLAEAKLAFSGFALSLGNDKNQLLNRIKRIMEKSVNSNSGRGRTIVPVVLLLCALMCISWLGSHEEEKVQTSDHVTATEPDTIPKNGNRASFSRKRIITLDKNGQPHEEIIEEFEGDENLRKLLENGAFSQGFAAPSFPDIDPRLFDMNRRFNFHMDTVPPLGRFHNGGEWDEMTDAFEENFKKQMEFLQQFRANDSLYFGKDFQLGMAFPDFESLQLPGHALDILKEFDMSHHDFSENFERLKDLRFEHEFNSDNLGMDGFQNGLRDELIEDGYLSRDEAIESLEWNDSTFKVNGRTLKDSDREKYQKFFGKKEAKKFE